MAVTVNNLTQVSLLNILTRTQYQLDNTMNRMTTGSKVSRGSDDPAGLIGLTALNSEITSVDSALTNNQRTDAMVGVAEGALAEVGNLVAEIQQLASQTANESALSAEEKAANQAQIDDALASIDRIISNTAFNGKKLLDGSLAITADVAAADLGKLNDIKVYSRKPTSGDTTITVQHLTAATAADFDDVIANPAALASDTVFSIEGKLGTAVIDIASNEALANIVAKVNSAIDLTGVSAVAASGDLRLTSREKGDNAFVRVKVIEGDTTGVAQGTKYGTDADVRVNGQKAAVDGTHVSYSGGGVSVAFDIGTLAAAASMSFTVKAASGSDSSGATFQLGTTSETRTTIGIDGMYTYQLGTLADGYLSTLASGGENSLLEDPSKAASIARKAASQIATARGRLGGFQKFQVHTSLNSLQDMKEGLEKAASVIRDVDYAKESSDLNRYNILMQSAMSLLGLANQQSASVLSLLR